MIKYYSFVEPAGLEGLFRITWENTVPVKAELERDGNWIDWPPLMRHFVPGGLGLVNSEWRSDRVVEVPDPEDASENQA